MGGRGGCCIPHSVGGDASWSGNKQRCVAGAASRILNYQLRSYLAPLKNQNKFAPPFSFLFFFNKNENVYLRYRLLASLKKASSIPWKHPSWKPCTTSLSWGPCFFLFLCLVFVLLA
uniref:Uncharacterized protein n=1 Tax=Morchella brunnea TaxID=1174671 RepID=A0A8K1MES3_9PEZI|nr:hypothetical protein LK370_mgp253 [Morchella brunnea]UBU98419.1 hypothetical protein [Morchella brunnea]